MDPTLLTPLRNGCTVGLFTKTAASVIVLFAGATPPTQLEPVLQVTPELAQVIRFAEAPCPTNSTNIAGDPAIAALIRLRLRERLPPRTNPFTARRSRQSICPSTAEVRFKHQVVGSLASLSDLARNALATTPTACQHRN